MKIIDTWLKQLHDEVGSDLFITVDAPPCIKVHGLSLIHISEPTRL